MTKIVKQGKQIFGQFCDATTFLSRQSDYRMQDDEIVDGRNDEEMENLVMAPIEKPMMNRQGNTRLHLQQQQHQQMLVNEKARIMPLTHLYAEDMRISKILRRLMGESNPVAAMDICEKLETAVRSPSNTAYICRSTEMLLDNLTQVLKQCPHECVDEVCNILGLIGYISRTNFAIYKNHITKTYQASKVLRKYMMLALKTTFRCDAINLDLLVYSERMLKVLIGYLENADKTDIFIAISDTILDFSKNYERAFAEHFTDIVDIVVGWHLETDQPQSLKLHCALLLQQWAAYFLNEPDFTYDLLGQFLEDILGWINDLTSEAATRKTKNEAEMRIASFLGAFTTIFKSLSTTTEFVGLTADYNFVDKAASVILKAAKEIFSLTTVGEESVVNINDILSLFLANNYNHNNISHFEELITLQIGHLRAYNTQQSASLLYLIVCLVRLQRTTLSRSVITLLLGTVDNPLAALKLMRDTNVYKLLLKIYHEILMLKNVPLLQEAYKHIKLDIDENMKVLQDAAETVAYSTSKFACAVQYINFDLSALSVLATQTSSIISIYALDPSILELLIHNCKAANTRLWTVEPTLHNALLHLLAVHCQKNNNFMTSSSLLQRQHYGIEEKSHSSPSSEHFTQILQFLATILKGAHDLSIENLKLMLHWLEQLFAACKEHMLILLSNTHFLNISAELGNTALYAPLETANCMQQLLSLGTLPGELLSNFRDAAIYQLNSNKPEIMKSYAEVLACLPLGICLAPCDLGNGASAQPLAKVYDSEKWYRSNQHYAPLRVKYFKEFLEIIDEGKVKRNAVNVENLANTAQSLDNIFKKCWINLDQHENAAQYQEIARQHNVLISSWIECEVARYCVRNKLRTTVGKPQETFLAIEAIVLKYARMLAGKECKERQTNGAIPLENAVDVQHKARILLGFLESLEKHIYNAAQGTAFAIPVAEKPARTFFRINATTCNEWFKRIRPAVCLIALHCMEPEMIIRYAELTLTNIDQLNSALLEHTLINLAGALVTCKEADALSGLNVWLRAKTGKRLAWLQYAAEQAAGHLEQAANGYKNLLDENATRMDGHVKQFVLEQLLECLYYTGQWSEMRQLIKTVAKQTQTDGAGTLYNARCVAHLDTMQALCYGSQRQEMEEADNTAGLAVSDALLQLMDWSTCEELVDSDFTAKEQTILLPSFSNYNILRQLEDACIVHTLKTDDATNLPFQIVEAIQAGVREAFSRGCNLEERKLDQANSYIFINQTIKNLRNWDNAQQEPLKIAHEQLNDASMLTKSLQWTLLFEQRSLASGAMVDTNAGISLFLDVAANARYNGNYNYCRNMLKRFFALKGFEGTLSEIAQQWQQNEQRIDLGDNNLLRGISELSKCFYASSSNTPQCEAINLAAALCTQVVEEVDATNASFPAVGAKTLLALAEWLTQRSSTHNMSSLPQLQLLLTKLPDTTVQLNDDVLDERIPAVDKAVGKLINASIWQKNDAGDAWLAYGNWCYRWGKKLVELKNVENEANTRSAAAVACELSERDLNEIKTILQRDFSTEVLSQIANVLQRHDLGNKADFVDDEIESSDMSSAELIEQELRQLDALADMTAEQLTDIIGVWRQAHKSVYAYYDTAIRAYLKYLTIETSSPSSVSSKVIAEQNVEDCGFVTTTLRILRLVVKHAFALQDVLEEGLNTTPLRPWKVIIPQLFSRLNHHEPYVRNSLAQLLCRLAQDEPHAVIFPAVVGAQQEGLQVNSASIATPTTPSSPTTIALSNCFGSLLVSLSRQAPETVRHVQLLVKELRRVALLWEEYWLHALGQLLTEYSSLFNALEIETKKCGEANVQQLEKLKVKHELLLKYVIADLQKIALNTEKPAETNYERCFQEHYQTHIQRTMNELAQPLALGCRPSSSWQKIKSLYQRFQQRSMHGSASSASTLKINDLSPVLANMRDTAISMPGVDTTDGNPIYIKAIESTVFILPTKTRPKKLCFLGSDGRKYTYLFKGLEDLHLDERIMQFLSISNLMMERTRDRLHQKQLFRAHYYSVIPLGPQSGLISWVDGVTPLFAVYKKWQQRDAALKQLQQKERPSNEQQQSPNLPSSQITALRPSEMFYKKLTPLLAAQHVKLSDPRKQWPLSVLRRVLDELSEETPCDLLSKELWCHATSAAEWRKTVRSYSISMAVMSVIGYVIGLGDRHLDNVLINLSTGEIVHIDYNVCFEKGKTLRVPEKVPFRMTPNLEDALGVTGIEGIFRLGCEHVLRVLRKEKETLLTLLEAFVYDPLVDWTVSDDGVGGGAGTVATSRATSAHAAMQSLPTLKLASGNIGSHVLARDSSHRVSKQYELVQRKQEWELMQQSIKTRFEDIKNHWAEYIDDIFIQMNKISLESQELNAKLKAIHDMEEERNKLNQQVTMIRELEMLGTAIGSHSLNTITQRFQAYKHDAEALESLQKSARVAYSDIETLLNTYFGSIIGDSNELMALQMELYQLEINTYENEFDVVREQLQQVSVKLYEDVNFARKEMDNSLQQEARTAIECMKHLEQYARIMDFYPRKRLRQQNRLLRYADWYRQLWREDTDLMKLKAEVEECLKFDEEAINSVDESAEHKTNIIQYATLMEQMSYELNLNLHQAMMKEVNLLPQQPTLLESAIAAIEDYLKVESNDAESLQHAVLETLTESLTLLEINEQTPNLLAQNAYLEHLEFMLKQTNLTPEGVYQLSCQKMLNSLAQTLEIMEAFERDFVVEQIVRLYFLDDNTQVQNYLLELCNGNVHTQLPLLNTTDVAVKQLHIIMEQIQQQFHLVETALHHLKAGMQPIEAIDTTKSSWRNTTLESLIIVSNLNDADLLQWKNETVSSLFSLVHDQVTSLNSARVENIYDIRKLYAPIRNYITQIYKKYLSRLTFGLAEAYITSFHKQSSPQSALVTTVTPRLLCDNLLAALRVIFEMKQQRLEVQQLTQQLDHNTRIATAHYWANQTLLLQHNANATPCHVVYKEKLLNVIGNLNQSMSAWKHTIVKIQDELTQHTEVVQQRLHWLIANDATIGDGLNERMAHFEECSTAQATRYHFFLQLAVKLIEHASVLLQFETLMDDNIAGVSTRREAENSFCVLIDDWQQVQLRYTQSNTVITPVERSIVQLLDPEDKVDACWIANISGLLDELTFSVQKNLTNLEEERNAIQRRLYDNANELQLLTENPLRMELRQLLRLIIKNAKHPTRGNGSSSPNLAEEAYLTTLAREVLLLLKQLIGKLGELKMKLCVRDDYDEEILRQLDEKLREVQNTAKQHHEEFLNLLQYHVEQGNGGGPTSSSGTSPAHKASPATDKLQKDSEYSSTARETTVANVEKKGEQKRNAYAVSVWKRIRMKLEGRDPDSNRRSTVAEQVDFIIAEATNRDNLAVLYEGWTPWV